MKPLEWIVIVGIAYLLGSIPFGVVFSKWLKGIDPRETGSRNIGFSNVLRIAGWAPGLLTLLGDMGKGVLSVSLTKSFAATQESLILAAGIATVIGHNHSIFLKLKGGKGVATGLGVLLGINPLIGAILLLVWITIVGIWKISSLGAIVSFTILPVVAWGLERNVSYLVFAVILSVIILIRHRINIQRLMKGVEPKLQRP